MDTPKPVAEEAVPEDSAFRIALPSFDGPLDLLLHLIRKHELDILDLPVSFVTERYLEYLKMMRELDLDVASEYLLMAATLAHIKSKMLLPETPDEQQDDGEEGAVEDPRAELIRRLLEYQKYREAGEALGERPIAGRDVFTRGTPSPEAEGPAPLAELGLFKLLDAFQAILKRAHNRQALEVTAERITIQERMTELTELLQSRRACQFDELFEEQFTRYEIVVTFLALLEMTKMRLTRIYQADHASPIHIQYALLDADAPTVPPEAPTSDGDARQESTSDGDARQESTSDGDARQEPTSDGDARQEPTSDGDARQEPTSDSDTDGDVGDEVDGETEEEAASE